MRNTFIIWVWIWIFCWAHRLNGIDKYISPSKVLKFGPNNNKQFILWLRYFLIFNSATQTSEFEITIVQVIHDSGKNTPVNYRHKCLIVARNGGIYISEVQYIVFCQVISIVRLYFGTDDDEIKTVHALSVKFQFMVGGTRDEMGFVWVKGRT